MTCIDCKAEDADCLTGEREHRTELGAEMTNAELVALLHEMREVALAARNHGSSPYAQWDRDQHTADRVLRRIEAAFAAFAMWQRRGSDR